VSVGGKVINHKIFDEKVYIDTDDNGSKVANRYCKECRAQAPQDTWNKRVNDKE
jgi:hypothetical protein